MGKEKSGEVDFYKQDGVNLTAEDAFSKSSFKLCQRTYAISPYMKVHDFSRGHFRGPRGFALQNLPAETVLTGGADGIGTAVVNIDAADQHDQAATKLVAMTGMDITRWGGMPLLLFNMLDLNELGDIGSPTYNRCVQLMIGLQRVCLEQRIVMYTGETAELGLCVGSENPNAKVKFNWGSVMLGAAHPDKIIRGDTLRPGQIIMVLRDSLRSNGYSLVRKALAMKYGPEWWKNPEAREDIAASVASAAQYDRMFNEMHGWFNASLKPLIELHLVVHLSGGAFKTKLGKDLLEPLGLSAEIDSLFEPSPIMKKCAEWRGLPVADCYDKLNGGQGALAVIDGTDEELFVKIAGKYGHEAKKAGRITEKEDYTIALTSQFGDGEIVYY